MTNFNIIPRKSITTKSKWDHNDSIRATKLVLDNDENDKVIDQTSTAIPDLETEILLMLEMRAMAWARKGQYENELQDASTMIKYAPYKPEGYLITGRRYVKQGFHERGVDIFTKGLQQVPQTDKQYSILFEEKEQTQRQLDKGDYLFNYFLPYDLIYTIIDFLPQDSVIQCGLVSSEWRSLILNYPKTWRHVNLDRTERSIIHTILPSVSSHIETLNVPGGKAGYQYMELIHANNFSKLSSLEIRKYTFTDSKHHYYMVPIYSALHTVSDTLTSLDITLDRENDTPSLATLLSICPNLTSLKFTARCIHAATPFSIARPTRLITLKLNTAFYEKIRGDELQKMLQAMPRLRWLSICQCDTDIYQLVEQYCPDINILIAGTSLPKFDAWVPDTTIPGLQSLYALNSFVMPGSNTLPLLETYHATLRKLLLQNTPPLTESNWQHLSSLGFAHLTEFNLVRADCAVLNNLVILLTSMPNLESLTLTGNRKNSRIPDNTLKYLGRMHKLTCLKLTDVEINVLDICHVLENFVQRENNKTSNTATVVNPSPLTELDLINVKNINSTVMNTITRIRSLKCLGMDYDEPSETIRRSFIQGISKLPLLENLFFMDLHISEEELYLLGTISTLTYVELDGVYGIEKHQVDEAFSSQVTVECYL
ncbi:hypothetical protein BDA99DRAFT_502961 [Phascolomyces articulosus]|uniref:F-box domain-containing protein n=1 Tax=Phascolomyces articulosus TaxID=60185 RepID=A0AAD5KEV7_9FUNG|nr:hypothetical protein BDA99DRAFT_502961 [Phascolomyces articulosus]